MNNKTIPVTSPLLPPWKSSSPTWKDLRERFLTNGATCTMRWKRPCANTW